MRIIYRHKYDKTKPCVAKLWFGDEYFILKTPDIVPAVKKFIALFQDSQGPAGSVREYSLRRTRKAVLNTAAAGKPCIVEILHSTSKGEELLAKEQSLLNLRSKECLNVNKIPGRPAWIYALITERQPGAPLFKVKGRHRASPAVVKIWIGEKFFIWKCKDIQEWPLKFGTSMERNILANADQDFGVLNPLVDYMRKVPGVQAEVEVVFKSECSWPGAQKLLKTEKKLLDKFCRTSNCLNKSVVPYLPEWIFNLQVSSKK